MTNVTTGISNRFNKEKRTYISQHHCASCCHQFVIYAIQMNIVQSFTVI